MSNKEFKHLNKAELLEVIYRLQMRELSLMQELETWKAKADERYEKLSDSGNIAEAALSIHNVFSAAQRAADDYVSVVMERSELQRVKTEALMQRAYSLADDIRLFLDDLDFDEVYLESYRNLITSILEEIASLLQETAGGSA